MNSKPCLLCDELLNNEPLSVRLGVCEKAGDNVLLESDRFVLIRDISPLIPGHSLLVSKRHCSSFAQISEEEFDDLQLFKNECVEYISSRFSHPFLFEHGSVAKPSRSGACIDHAHLHLLPAEAPVSDWMQQFGSLREIPTILESRKIHTCRSRDYLAYEDSEGKAVLLEELQERLPCQFIRRRLAHHLNLQSWHWKSVLPKSNNGHDSDVNSTPVAQLQNSSTGHSGGT